MSRMGGMVVEIPLKGKKPDRSFQVYSCKGQEILKENFTGTGQAKRIFQHEFLHAGWNKEIHGWYT